MSGSCDDGAQAADAEAGCHAEEQGIAHAGFLGQGSDFAGVEGAHGVEEGCLRGGTVTAGCVLGCGAGEGVC